MCLLYFVYSFPMPDPISLERRGEEEVAAHQSPFLWEQEIEDNVAPAPSSRFLLLALIFRGGWRQRATAVEDEAAAPARDVRQPAAGDGRG